MNEIKLFRIIDANLNRLREGLRVVEEYFRFYDEHDDLALSLKELRHTVRDIESFLPIEKLLQSRDSDSDIFSSGDSGKELERSTVKELIFANIRRAEEAARVLEEFLKFTERNESSNVAKRLRFQIYTVEKHIGGILGKEE